MAASLAAEGLRVRSNSARIQGARTGKWAGDVTGAAKRRVAPKEALPIRAVTVAVRTPAPAGDAVNVAEVAPAGTRTESGTLNSRLLLNESETIAPAGGAGAVRVTVQTGLSVVVRAAGVQLSAERTLTGAERPLGAADTPLGVIETLLGVRETLLGIGERPLGGREFRIAPSAGPSRIVLTTEPSTRV